MKHDLPTPEQILEELADKVAAQIERSAPVAFDNAMEELLRYHEFLLSLNTTQHMTGEAFSFAQVSGGEFSPPHLRWIRTYRRLFERAADRIPTESHFLRVLSRVPLRLLEPQTTAELPTEIIEWIIRTGPTMMHQVEAWVARRTTVEVLKGASAAPRLVLAGVDEKSYANVLPDIIGSWERLLQLAPHVYRWRDSEGSGQDRHWKAFAASWRFLWQHLSSTAYCLALAVWNEDEAGARYFREALVRWPGTLGHRNQDHLMQWENLVYPTVMMLDFTGAVSAAATLRFENALPPTAEELFDTVIRAAHHDVLLLTSAVLLSWAMKGKQASDIGGRTARALLLREGADQFHQGPADDRLNFRTVTLGILRIWMASQDQSGRSYDSDLDRLVESLDDMTEGKIVPGRVYTPSTLNGYEDLVSAFAAILTAALADAGDQNVAIALRELSVRDDRLPGADASLREVLRNLDQLVGCVEQLSDEIALVQPSLRGADVSDPKEGLANVLERMRQVIREERQKHLDERDVSPRRVASIRASIEESILKSPQQHWFFRDVAVQQSAIDIGEIVEQRLIVKKAQLVEPPMEAPWIGLEEWVSSNCRGRVAFHAWESFLRRPRKVVGAPGSVVDEIFWQTVSLLAEQLREGSAMVMPDADADLLRPLVYARKRGESKLRVEHLEGFEASGTYMAHVEGIAVHGGGDDSNGRLLFSQHALRQIDHGIIEGGHVTVEFDPAVDAQVRLRVKFRQQEHWSAAPIFQFSSGSD